MMLLVDCEGGELQLLDPEQVPGIQGCDVIVECHDFLNSSITPTLQKRFAASHDVELISEGPRDPNQFPSLQRWQSTDRWLAVNEKSSDDDELAGVLGPPGGLMARGVQTRKIENLACIQGADA